MPTKADEKPPKGEKKAKAPKDDGEKKKVKKDSSSKDKKDPEKKAIKDPKKEKDPEKKKSSKKEKDVVNQPTKPTPRQIPTKWVLQLTTLPNISLHWCISEYSFPVPRTKSHPCHQGFALEVREAQERNPCA